MPQKTGFFKKNGTIAFISLFIALLIGGVYALVHIEPIFMRSSLSKGGSYVGEAKIGGAFHMLNQDGMPVTESILKGKKTLMFFGYTHCPDICPTTILTVMQTLELLPENERKKYQTIFVSIDPARDTPELLKEYLANFDKAYIGLTGTPEALKEMAKNYLVYYAVSPNSDPEYYLMDHSAYIYLFDEDGKYQKHFSHKSMPQEIIEKLNQY